MGFWGTFVTLVVVVPALVLAVAWLMGRLGRRSTAVAADAGPTAEAADGQPPVTPPPPPGPRWRSVASTVLVAVGAVALVASTVFVWADRTLLDSDRAAAMARDLLEQPEIRTAITEGIVDALDRDGRLGPARPVVGAVVEVLVASDDFSDVFAEAVEQAHRVAIEQQTPGLVLQLGSALDVIRAAVRVISPALAALVPSSADLNLVLLDRTGLGQVWAAVDAFHRTMWFVLVGGVVALAAGILLSERRVRAGALAGWVGAGAAATVFITLVLANRVALDAVDDPVNRAAVGAAWDQSLQGLQRQTFVVALLAVAVALVCRTIATGRVPAATAAGAASGVLGRVGAAVGTIGAAPAPAPAGGLAGRGLLKVIGLSTLGVLVLLRPESAAQVAVVVVAVACWALAFREALRLLGPAPQGAADTNEA